jgi:hypothetical protein
LSCGDRWWRINPIQCCSFALVELFIIDLLNTNYSVLSEKGTVKS